MFHEYYSSTDMDDGGLDLGGSMSGSGYKVGRAHSGSHSTDDASGARDCTSIHEETTLTSPIPDVLEKLQPSQALNLTLQQPKSHLLAMTSDGEVAGAIAQHFLIDL